MRGLVVAATVAVMGAAAGGCAAAGTDPGFVSVGYYPQKVAREVPPEQVDYSAFTSIASFGARPTAAGDLTGVDAATLKAQVAAAHDAGKQAVLVVGEEGSGATFVAATRPGTRDRFVRTIKDTVDRYGYDGVDIDWEEQVPQHREQYTALLAGLRKAQVGKLWIPVTPGQQPPPLVADVAPSVDHIDVMAYTSDGSAWIREYRKAGVPAGKLVLGIGLSSDEHDRTPADVAGKVDLAKKMHLAGVFCWQIGFLHPPDSDPRLAPLRDAVSGT